MQRDIFRIAIAFLTPSVFSVYSSATAQLFTSPVRITHGLQNDLHPALINSPNWWFGPAEEWLAFSRDGKTSC